MGSFQSGQMEQTVNLLSEDFRGSSPLLPTNKHPFLGVFLFLMSFALEPLGKCVALAARFACEVFRAFGDASLSEEILCTKSGDESFRTLCSRKRFFARSRRMGASGRFAIGRDSLHELENGCFRTLRYRKRIFVFSNC